jgi:excisionase family DNA binding protein
VRGDGDEGPRDTLHRSDAELRSNVGLGSSVAFDALLDVIADRVAARIVAPSAVGATPQPPLVSKQGLAAALSCSAATIDRLVREQKLPYYQVGDSRRFDVAEVRAALRQLDAVSACGTAVEVAPKAHRLQAARVEGGVVWAPRRGARGPRKDG